MSYFGNYLRKVRKENKVTLKELGESTELTHGFLSNIETGKRVPSKEVIEKLSKALGETADDLQMRVDLDTGEKNMFLSFIEENYPATYHIMMLRMKSSKTYHEISLETGLEVLKINDLEERMSDNMEDYNVLGKAYGVENLPVYLTSRINDLNKNHWMNRLGPFETAKSIENDRIAKEEKEREELVENLSDLHVILNNFESVYYKKKLLTDSERKKVTQMLKIIFASK